MPNGELDPSGLQRIIRPRIPGWPTIIDIAMEIGGFCAHGSPPRTINRTAKCKQHCEDSEGCKYSVDGTYRYSFEERCLNGRWRKDNSTHKHETGCTAKCKGDDQSTAVNYHLTTWDLLYGSGMCLGECGSPYCSRCNP
jgi:hypothetical protein